MADQTSVVSPPSDAAVIPPSWSRTTRTIMTIFLIAGCVLGLVVISPLIQVIFLAFIFALMLFLPSRWLARRTPLKFKTSVLVTYLIVLVVLIFLVLVIVPALINGINNLLVSLQEAYNNFVVWLQNYQPSDGVVNILGFDVNLDPLIEPIRNLILGIQPPVVTDGAPQVENVTLGGLLSGIGSIFLSITRIAAGFITSVVGFVTTFGFALFVSFLLLLELPSARNVLPKWVNAKYQRELALILYHLDEVWLGFLKGEVIIGFLQAITAFIVFTILGLPGALFLAILDGTLGLIPSIGGIIAGFPVALVGLLLGSYRFPEMSHVTFTILVFLINGILSQVIFTFVSPMVMSKQVNLSTLIIIVGIAIGFSLGGILGALLVVPIMSSVKVVFGYILAKLADREPFPDEAPPQTEAPGFFSQIYETDFENKPVAAENP